MAQRLRVLSYAPSPERHNILALDSVEQLPFIDGAGGDDQVCGYCGLVLLSQVENGQVSNVVLKCPGCGAFNAA